MQVETILIYVFIGLPVCLLCSKFYCLAKKRSFLIIFYYQNRVGDGYVHMEITTSILNMEKPVLKAIERVREDYNADKVSIWEISTLLKNPIELCDMGSRRPPRP